MMILRKEVVTALLVLLGACGGDEEGTGFVVRAKVRGINIAAISQFQVRFEATGGDEFRSGSGSEDGVDYRTEDDGHVFAATAGRSWVTSNYELSESEFVFTMPFVNPGSGGDVNLHVLIHRDIDGDLVLVGESALTPTQLPAGSGAEVEVVVGCVRDAPCGAEIE